MVPHGRAASTRRIIVDEHELWLVFTFKVLVTVYTHHHPTNHHIIDKPLEKELDADKQGSLRIYFVGDICHIFVVAWARLRKGARANSGVEASIPNQYD